MPVDLTKKAILSFVFSQFFLEFTDHYLLFVARWENLSFRLANLSRCDWKNTIPPEQNGSEIKISAGPPCRCLQSVLHSAPVKEAIGNLLAALRASAACVSGARRQRLSWGAWQAPADHVTVDAVRNGGRSPFCGRNSPFLLIPANEFGPNRVQGALEHSAERFATPAAASQRCSARIANDTPGVSTRLGCCRTKNH